MYEEEVTHPVEVHTQGARAVHNPILRYLLLAVALIYVLASLYFMYTLKKGQKQPISTVSLEVKKVDAKKSRFTLNVIADDKTIEKKDRTVGEPLQFYTGRDHLLYEVVAFSADKNSITGYLSTPKNAPKPVTP